LNIESSLYGISGVDYPAKKVRLKITNIHLTESIVVKNIHTYNVIYEPLGVHASKKFAFLLSYNISGVNNSSLLYQPSSYIIPYGLQFYFSPPQGAPYIIPNNITLEPGDYFDFTVWFVPRVGGVYSGYLKFIVELYSNVSVSVGLIGSLSTNVDIVDNIEFIANVESINGINSFLLTEVI